MKRTRKIICVALVVATFMSLFWLPSNASTYFTSGLRTLNPNKYQLRAGENPKYRNQIETIGGEIRYPLEANVYHYIVPASGEYFIYTTGSLDTVGRLYKYKWTWANGFKPQTDEIDDQDYSAGRTTNRNFFTRITLSQGDNLYVVIRAFGNGIGEYQLHIEPYRDMLVSSQVGTWEYDSFKTPPLMDHQYYAYSTFTEEQLLYFSADQTAALADFLTDQGIRTLIENYYESHNTSAVLLRAAQQGLGVLSTLEAVGLIEVKVVAGALEWCASTIVDYWCDAIYQNPEDVNALIYFIICGCGYRTNSYPEPLDNGQISSTRQTTCTRGLTYRTKTDWSWLVRNNDYDIVNCREYRDDFMGRDSDPTTHVYDIGEYNSNKMYGKPFVHSGWRFSDLFFSGAEYCYENSAGRIIPVTPYSAYAHDGSQTNGRNQLY